MTAIALMPVTHLLAQTLTISPTMPQIGLGKTVQFSVRMGDAQPPAVNWAAGGIVGGNSKSGTITATGLYTAPSKMPAQNPVLITATTKTKPNRSASTYVLLLKAAPTISSVTPNPLDPGTITVTITGSGFEPNAVANDSGVQLSTVSVTSTKLVATGYQPPAAFATFTVKNPGSEFSNAITVPVTGGSNNHTLTVVNGSGSGSYASGAVVNIAANPPPLGQNFVNWTGFTVANPNSANTTLTMPNANVTVVANYTSTTAHTLTVVNGTGSGNYTAGTVVPIAANTPPAGQFFVNWTGATVADPSNPSTTLTMPNAAATVTANYGTAPTIPYPVSTHPRLWLTVNDLARLRSWAVNSNPIYSQGMVPLLNQALNVYNTQFFPGGVQNPNYPDPGDTQGYTGYLTEQYAIVLAFNSLIDPSTTNRISYAQKARNMLMVAMNQAALGHQDNTPFRDRLFAVYNRANGSGEQWPLIVDWIYSAVDGQGNPILTAADKATIRKVFMIWANDCLQASTTGGDHPEPMGVTNSHQLLPNNLPYRMASNNYYLGHARLLTMMALSIDPSDDPNVDPSQPASKTGNSLRSYILNANGAWLYQEYAMMGEAAQVASDYGIPGNGAGFGLSSGGLPPEGMLYGHSYAYILSQLLSLQTAGFHNASFAGPQINLIGSPVWDRFVNGFASSLTQTSKVFPEDSWLGPIYQDASYGDLLRLWITPDFMQPFALLTLLDHQNGVTTHDSAAKWLAVEAVEGGTGALMQRITDPWSWSSSQSILYYMMLDPAAAPANDPRPSLPTTFYDQPAGRILAHSDWTPTGSMFDYRSSWISINHQDGDAGQFELFRNGEWLTKEMSNYDNNGVGLTTVYHNTLALQNWCANGTPNLQWYEQGEWANGSQWIIGLNAGDPVNVMSTGPGYVYTASDLTKLYNRPDFWTPANGAVDIAQATRSVLWINKDFIVVYDRATSNHAGLFKRFNLSLQANPSINGKVATDTLASGQKLFVQTLLPLAPSITAAYTAGNLNPIAELEPTKYILTVEDPAKPANVRFLHVLQGADASTTMTTATYLKSSSGTDFDGTAVGAFAIFFPVNVGAVATTTFTLPAGVHTLLITGLTPNTAYGLTIQGTTITVTPGGSGALSDNAGLLRIVF